MATHSPWCSNILGAALFGAIVACSPPAIGADRISCEPDLDGARLSHYAIYDGDPAREVQQAPYNEGGGARAAYDVRRSISDDPVLGFVLVCEYARGSRIRVTLPASVGVCEAAGSDFRPNVVCR